jgi:hypothetical protein
MTREGSEGIHIARPNSPSSLADLSKHSVSNGGLLIQSPQIACTHVANRSWKDVPSLAMHNFFFDLVSRTNHGD